MHRRLAGVPRGAAAAASLLDGLYGAKVRPADRPAEEGELSSEHLPQLPSLFVLFFISICFSHHFLYLNLWIILMKTFNCLYH